MNRRKLIGTAVAVMSGGLLTAFKFPAPRRADKNMYSNWDYDSLMHYAANKYFEKNTGVKVNESSRIGGNNFTRIYWPHLLDIPEEFKNFVDLRDNLVNEFAGELVANGEIKAVYWA